MCPILLSVASCTGSAGVPGCEAGALWPGNESRWIRACLEARRLISRRPARSPLLKFPFPCLNSQSAESGDPVWKTSLTSRIKNGQKSPKSELACETPTFVKPIHIQLSNEGGDIGMFEVRSARVRDEFIGKEDSTHARTLENSDVGDMTKLSFVPDQEMRCWMLGSSSILFSKNVSRWR
jgi:hypothetical protein